MVGRVISEAFDAYGALFGVLIPVTAAVVVPYEAALLALQLASDDTDEARIGLQVIDGVASLLLVLPLLLVVVTRAAQSRERGEAPAPWRALTEAFELLVPIAGTQLLLLLAIALLPGLVMLLGLAVGAPGLVLAGLIALVGSAVINGVRLSLALPVVLLEGIRYGGALRRSVELVRGYWRPVCLTVLALAGCVVLLDLAAAASAQALIGEGRVGDAVAQRLAGTIGTILATPLLALGALQLYRLRTETAVETEVP